MAKDSAILGRSDGAANGCGLRWASHHPGRPESSNWLEAGEPRRGPAAGDGIEPPATISPCNSEPSTAGATSRFRPPPHGRARPQAGPPTPYRGPQRSWIPRTVGTSAPNAGPAKKVSQSESVQRSAWRWPARSRRDAHAPTKPGRRPNPNPADPAQDHRCKRNQRTVQGGSAGGQRSGFRANSGKPSSGPAGARPRHAPGSGRIAESCSPRPPQQQHRPPAIRVGRSWGGSSGETTPQATLSHRVRRGRSKSINPFAERGSTVFMND